MQADDAGAAQQTPPGGGEFVTPSPPGNAPMPPPPQRNNGVRGIGVGVGGAGRGRGRGGRAPAHQQQQQQQQPPDSAELSGGTQRKNPGRLFQDTAPGLRCAFAFSQAAHAYWRWPMGLTRRGAIPHCAQTQLCGVGAQEEQPCCAGAS